MADSDDVFSRWSQRKRAVAKEAAVTDKPPEPVLPGVDIPEPESEEQETELLDRLGLPVPESLREGDDFSIFMKAGVPDFLRKRALRVLWRSNPVLANLDGLNDYDEDFNSPELTQKVLATAYQVGRGFVKEVLENQDAEPVADDMPDDLAATEHEDGPASHIEPAPEYEFETAIEEDEDPHRPRRMRFQT